MSIFHPRRTYPEHTAAAAAPSIPLCLPCEVHKSLRSPFRSGQWNTQSALHTQKNQSVVTNQQLYYAMRDSIPLVDAAIDRLVRLVGGFSVEVAEAGSSELQAELNRLLQNIPVNGGQEGVSAFVDGHFAQLLTLGTALGEICVYPDGSPAALVNVPLEGITLRRNPIGLQTQICTGESDKLKPAKCPELLLLSILNPAPGALCGNSILQGLPFVSGVLLQILEGLGQNWERLGNVRFAVSYKPGNTPLEQAQTAERTKAVAEAWQNAMREGSGTCDFITAGDVQIKVIGAEAQLPDAQLPARLLMEQIVAKTGLPPFLLGLSWNSTERMSAQQADLLTSELESYRRVLEPVILRIANMLLRRSMRCTNPPLLRIKWDDITLADAVETARAKLLQAQAAKS